MFFKKSVLFLLSLLWRLAVVVALLLLAALVWLNVAQVSVPDRWLRAALARCDAPDSPFLLDITAADISFSRLNLHDIKAIQKGSLDAPPRAPK